MRLASKTAIAIRKWTMLTHRWMGVVFCLLFLVWFVSGIVMMYWRFPRVEAEDRLSHAMALDPQRIRIAAAEASEALHLTAPPSQVRLNVLDGRPVYRIFFGRRSKLVYADDGKRIDGVNQEMALRIASAWTGFPKETAKSQGLITKDDQWTIYSSVHPYGPFWKYEWPNGEEIYVSQPTGEVVQDTTPASRLGAYFGAIPHWLYFTLLRTNGPLWTQVVIWLSAAGTVMSLLGMIAGLWLYSPEKSYRFPEGRSTIPYAGFKRWHMVMGLIFGLVTCTWVFSGLLSMAPFSWLADADRPKMDRALRPDHVDLSKYALKDVASSIREAGASLSVKEIAWASLGGTAFYLALEAPDKTRIVAMNRGFQEAFSNEDILAAARPAAAPSEIINARLVTQYEPYYVDRLHERPLPVLYFELNDRGGSAYYVDLKTGRVVQSYGSRARWNRWLYHGLHSFDLPWLYAHRPAWDFVVMSLMLGGTALCLTSLVIAWKVLRRKFRLRRGYRIFFDRSPQGVLT